MQTTEPVSVTETAQQHDAPGVSAPGGEPAAVRDVASTPAASEAPIASPAAGGEPVAERLGEISRALATFGQSVRTLEEKYTIDKFREGQIDRLHEELQGHRADLVGKAVRPVLQSLVRLHDDMGKVLDALAAEDPGQLQPARLLKLLEGFREDVEIALDRNGVTAFSTASEQFDAKRQRVVRTVETITQAEVGRVVARVRPGFEQGEQILEKERVAVYVLAPVRLDGPPRKSP